MTPADVITAPWNPYLQLLRPIEFLISILLHGLCRFRSKACMRSGVALLLHQLL